MQDGFLNLKIGVKIYFLKKINIEFNKKIYTAWIYYASKSPHQKNIESNIIEILSPYISNIKNQKKCKILLDL